MAVLGEDDQRSSGTSFAAMALARIGDPSVIPELIQILATQGSTNPGLLYDVGYFGLHGLTGVSYAESHDGAWWLDWWEKNRVRFEGPNGR